MTRDTYIYMYICVYAKDVEAVGRWYARRAAGDEGLVTSAHRQMIDTWLEASDQ